MGSLVKQFVTKLQSTKLVELSTVEPKQLGKSTILGQQPFNDVFVKPVAN